MISATEMLWGLEACTRENFEMIGAIWSVFGVLFRSDLVVKSTITYYKK